MTILTAIDADPGCKEVIETAHELATGLDMELVIIPCRPGRKRQGGSNSGNSRNRAVGDR